MCTYVYVQTDIARSSYVIVVVVVVVIGYYSNAILYQLKVLIVCMSFICTIKTMQVEV